MYHNPAYQSKGSVSKGSDGEDDKMQTFNQYEISDSTPVQEMIDDNLYKKVREETQKEAEQGKKTLSKKSRFNPVSNIDKDDDYLNPVTKKTSPKKLCSNPVYNIDEDDDYLKPVAKKTPYKKSRCNRVCNINEDDDSLNPVVNLPVRSPSKKANDDVFLPVHEGNDSDDSVSTKILISTFQPDPKPGPTYQKMGKWSHLAIHTLGE